MGLILEFLSFYRLFRFAYDWFHSSLVLRTLFDGGPIIVIQTNNFIIDDFGSDKDVVEGYIFGFRKTYDMQKQ